MEQSSLIGLLQNDGKIMVVVFCLVLILLGFFVYLFNTERKISAIEKKLNIKK